jgi:tetratricopeptide (TPR) repeat protein
VRLVNRAILRVDQRSTLRLEKVSPKPLITSLLRLVTGAIQAFSRKPRTFRVSSPIATIGIRGTEFYMRATEGETEITVLEGEVDASNDAGQIAVADGQTASIRAGEAPQARVLVNPRDRVQWALFYPPVLAAGSGADPVPGSLPREIERALQHMARRDVQGAFDALERVPEASRDAQFYVYRGALALSVGQVEATRADIASALERSPDSGLAHALRAVIHVVQNRPAEALADGERAVQLEPSPPTYIALSYAQQASFRIEAARDTLIEAVREHPSAPLAWARLAELWLMLGERQQASEAAARATGLAPGLARTQLTIGYAALAAFRGDEAKAAFDEALRIAPDDPLAHLGLGLARIARGDLEGGRAELEVAVALDSSSALLRAYLGKAYFSELRHPLDAEQFSIAKSLDPNDPTAHFYDAILKQTLNRPVEALDALERSIALNDNRAVYRGRLLLDKDRAARGTSLARVYDDLGFDRLAVNEATPSLARDPSNASAHRFLSDSYRSQPRREVARVSELLQSQMFQDVNLNPIQPSIASTNLNIVTSGGPTTPGFNEFTPLFERNRAQLNATGFAGSNGTRGGEAVLSGVFDNVSVSGGGYYFESDGFRENADLEHFVVDAFAQAAITPAVNVQVEFRDRSTEHGDIALDFDPNSFSPNLRDSDDEQTRRVGLRITPTTRSEILLSAIIGDRDRSRNDSRALPPVGEITRSNLTESLDRQDESEQFEGLFTFTERRFNLLGGGAYARVKTSGFLTATLDFTVDPAPTLISASIFICSQPPPPFGTGDTIQVPPGTPCPPPFFIGPLPITIQIPIDPPPFDITNTQRQPLDSVVDDYRAYGYANVEVLDGLVATFGLNYTDVESEFLDVERWNPKLGLRWDIGTGLRARAAFFKAVKPVLASNRVLEPTQVAGFNQFFDDADTSQSTGYGVALEWRGSTSLHGGIELTGREIRHPALDLPARLIRFEDRREHLHRAYVYWTPSQHWALGVEGVYDSFKNSMPSETVPQRVTTRSLPLKATYFHPGGLLGGITASYVSQKVTRQNSTLAQGSSHFGVVDLFGGYRLPRRLGMLSVSVHNLFDRRFRYQDDSYRTFGEEPSGTALVPERTFMGRLTLSF